MDPADWIAEDFLELIYGEHKGWIDLPTKIGSEWVPFYIEWPNDIGITRHIDAAVQHEEDLYYSVAKFSKKGRRIEDVLPCHWLWADLDNVDPTAASKLGLHPTLAIETSPHHHHALWQLSRELKPKSIAKLNRALTYALDADKGGWDLTQVLRIPSTRNFKYDGSPRVNLKWYHPDLIYEPEAVLSKIRKFIPQEELVRAVATRPKKPIPLRVKRLLRTPPDEVVVGERSDRLWEIEMGLAEAGLEEAEIFSLVWPSAWNKHKEKERGPEVLRGEIHKATLSVAKKALIERRGNGQNSSRAKTGDTGGRAGSARGLQKDGGRRAKEHDGHVVRGSDASDADGSVGTERVELVTQRFSVLVGKTIRRERWLIDRIWSANAQGIIGGEPKTSKSTIALAMGMAVASGRPFLGEYRVKGEGGPVLFVDCETGEYTTQDRARRIGAKMGLISEGDVAFGPGGLTLSLPDPIGDLPLVTVTDQPFNLAEDKYMDELRRLVEREKPVLIILDPLYLILGDVNENYTHELRPILNDLSKLRNESGAAIAIVHHYRKENEKTKGSRPGQRLSGSWAFHGWVASSIYCEKKSEAREGWTRVKMETEHRRSAARSGIELAWSMSESDEDLVGMEWEINVPQKKAVKQLEEMSTVEEIVSGEPDGIKFGELLKLSSVSRAVLRRYVDHNENLGFQKKSGLLYVHYVG